GGEGGQGAGGQGAGGLGGAGAGAGGAAPAGGGGAPSFEVGPVQCRVNSDCASGDCNRNAPGGICLGCPAHDCPGTSACFDGIVACITPCSTSADCNVGFSCSGNSRCVLRSCDVDADCAPYVCGGNGGNDQCVRPTCSGAEPCPAPFECVAAVCVEPE